jgi:hypothetical protein
MTLCLGAKPISDWDDFDRAFAVSYLFLATACLLITMAPIVFFMVNDYIYAVVIFLSGMATLSIFVSNGLVLSAIAPLDTAVRWNVDQVLGCERRRGR